MRAVVKLSPTQIKQWLPSAQGCNRKWYAKYILHVPEPPKKGTATGVRSHKQTENYLKNLALDYSTPEMREAAEIAIPGFVNLPPPMSPGMRVEEPFSFETADGIVYRGVQDVEVPDSIVIPGCEGGRPGIIDHKSTKAARYVKTPEDLLTDEQTNIYAYAMMAKYKSPSVDVVFNYIFTEGSHRTKRVHLVMHSPRVVQEFKRIQVVGREIAAAYENPGEFLDMPPNLSACDAFGGCPYKGLCTDLHSGPLGHITPDEVSEPFPATKGTPMSIDLFSRLESVKAQEDAAPMPAGITNAPPGYVPAPFLVGTAASTPAIFPPPLQMLPPNASPSGGAVVAINPPEWQPPPTPEQRAAAAVTPEAAPAKRKRRTKAEMELAAHDAAAPPLYVETGDDTHKTEPATIPAPAPTPAERVHEVNCYDAPKGFTLFLDCSPERTPVLHGSDLYGKVNEELQKTFGADFRRIKFEGPGLFVAGFLKLFDESPRDIVIDTRTAEGLLVVDSLRARAGLVVR